MKIAEPIPVINKANKRERPSNLKSKLTPNEGTQLMCCNCWLPPDIKGMCPAKNKNKTVGKIGRMKLHLDFKYLPMKTTEHAEINPDNIVNSIYLFCENVYLLISFNRCHLTPPIGIPIDIIKNFHVFALTERGLKAYTYLMESHKNSKKTAIFLGFFEENVGRIVKRGPI